MQILAIETSCDETALSLIEASGGLSRPSFSIIRNVIASQIAIHRPWGGVVPNLAKREHLKNLPLLFKRLYPNPLPLSPDLIAVTVGPGLEPALWAGIGFAKELHQRHFPKAKLVGANHLEGHLFSFLLAQKTANTKLQKTNSKQSSTPNYQPLITNYQLLFTKDIFPAVALLVSGGHTVLLSVRSLAQWKKLGETRDDAVGESFDKAARLLNLPYPGGPEIERIAQHGDPKAIPFPRPMMHSKDFDFSFSGLKTALLYYRRDHPRANVADIAASFQQAAVDVLLEKTARAAREIGARSVLLSGGVAANALLRTTLAAAAKESGLAFLAPAPSFNTDNASMIGAAAYLRFSSKKRGYPLRANGNLGI